jgi:hypothetical protein
MRIPAAGVPVAMFKTWVVSVAIEPPAATHYSTAPSILYTIRRTNRVHSALSIAPQKCRATSLPDRAISRAIEVALSGALVHSLSVQLEAVP